MRKYVIMGIQGSGKGTQAKMLAADLDLVHISVGDIFRWNVQNHTKLGAQGAAGSWRRENWSGTTWWSRWSRTRLTQHDWNFGFIIDGFPRDPRQAQFFLESYDIDGVIELDLPDSEVRRRVLNRRLCADCGNGLQPDRQQPDGPRPVRTPRGGELITREDDTEEALAVRLRDYHDQTNPVLAIFRRKEYVYTVTRGLRRRSSSGRSGSASACRRAIRSRAGYNIRLLLPLDDLRRRPRVHGVDVLLAPENCQHGVGLVVIIPQPDRERLLGVIFPGDQLPAAHVAPAGDRRAVGDQVVVHPAVGAQPAVENPAADLAVWQVKLDDAVDVVALQEELGLPRVPREPVDDEAEVPVVLGEPVPDHRLHQVVPDQFSRRHDPAHLRAQLGVVLHVPPEDVPHADVHQVQVRRQHLGLRPLATALNPHNHVFAHVTSLT